MKTTSTPAVEWPPGGAPPTRGTASQGRAATDFGALLDQTSARTAPAEGLKRDGDKTSSVAPRDDRREAAASSRPERPERPDHPHRTDRPERPERPEHPHAPVAEEAPEQPQGESAEGEQPAAPQAGTGEQQPGETVEQPAVAVPIEVVDVVLAELEVAPVVVAVEAPVAEAPAPVTSAPVVGPQPVAQAAAAPVIAAEQPVAAQVAQAVVAAAQPTAPAVGEQAVTAEQPVASVQQAQQAAQQPQQAAQSQPAASTQQQPQAQQAQAQAQPQPQADASAAPAVAERAVEGEQPLPNGQQQPTGEQQQPSGDQPANAARGRQPQPVSAPAESRVQAPAPNVIPGVNAPAIAEAQATARPADAPATRTVRMSPAAEAVENAIRIGQTRGVTHARMSLKPAELGGVEIRLAQSAQGLTATVVADGQQAAQLLQQAGQELRRSLEAQGIQLHQLDISYSGDQREGARSAQAQADGGDRRASGGADDSLATDGDGLTTTEDITVQETLELPDGVLVDVLA